MWKCLALILGLILAMGATFPGRTDRQAAWANAYFSTEFDGFARSAEVLRSSVKNLDRADPASIDSCKTALTNCRLHYKRIEFFLEYFFKSAARVYNAPPKYEVEVPYMEYQDPVGLQVIESFLFEPDPVSKKQELLVQADLVYGSASDLKALLYQFSITDAQLLESVRIELIRIAALSISGYDAPLLKSGIRESAASLKSVKNILSRYVLPGEKASEDVSDLLDHCIFLLDKNPGFDSFDRLSFLTGGLLPLQEQLSIWIRLHRLELNTTGMLNYNAKNLFSNDALNVDSIGKPVVSGKYAVMLGQKLFFENALSGSNSRNCASCHDPGKYFTDGLTKSVAANGRAFVQRNAPSLVYAAFQHTQFWDARAGSLEQQVREVLRKPDEMNGAYPVIIRRLKSDPYYRALFRQAFPAKNDPVTIDAVAGSVAAFIRTLSPRNSAFDRYMEGDSSALTTGERKGFNLFMGKAQCGTCHFAPLFNGLIPPLFKLSELEVIGVTRTDNLVKPVADTDEGRFKTFPIQFYRMAFKTPTVRNSSATAPYMHNGAFGTIDSVISFYNRGGGKGMGLDVPEQSLSPEPLKLTADEMADLKHFIASLTDKPFKFPP